MPNAHILQANLDEIMMNMNGKSKRIQWLDAGNQYFPILKDMTRNATFVNTSSPDCDAAPVLVTYAAKALKKAVCQSFLNLRPAWFQIEQYVEDAVCQLPNAYATAFTKSNKIQDISSQFGHMCKDDKGGWLPSSSATWLTVHQIWLLPKIEKTKEEYQAFKAALVLAMKEYINHGGFDQEFENSLLSRIFKVDHNSDAGTKHPPSTG